MRASTALQNHTHIVTTNTLIITKPPRPSASIFLAGKKNTATTQFSKQSTLCHESITSLKR